MKPATSMHERFNALTAPRVPVAEMPTEHWHDAEALEILARPTELSKSEEFRLKEHELGALFARLTVLEARQLHHRLSNSKPADPLSAAFSRLVAERRARLLAFLADARRRAAMQQSARGA